MTPEPCQCPLCRARSTTVGNGYLWALEAFVDAYDGTVLATTATGDALEALAQARRAIPERE